MEYSRSQVESFLLGRIDSDMWPVGARIPSERDLAEDLGVSRNMVRNAVLALAARGFLERSVGQGTFVRRKQTVAPPDPSFHGTLGYVVCKEKTRGQPITTEDFQIDVFHGIEEEAARSGRHTLFCYLDDFDAEDIDAFRAFLGKVDGIVVQEARNPQLLQSLGASAVPAVLLAPSESLPGLDSVTMDVPAAVAAAVRHLRGLGHHRIAIINGPLRLESARMRFKAWRDAMGPAADEGLVDGDGGWTAAAGSAAMKRLIERRPDLTAVCCANGHLALGALGALIEAGLPVPQRVSVMGLDDSEPAAYSSPPLTTMRIPARDMARTAARRLLERIEHENLPRIRIKFPIDLVIRASCAEAGHEAG